MGKLSVFVALFAALIVVASAATYTTVVTTTVDEEKSCQMEVQMQHCMQYMQSKMGRPYEVSFLRSAVANPGYQEEHLNECCNELRSVRTPCRCDAMRHIVNQMQQKYYGMDKEKQQMLKERVQYLPQMCKMSSPTQCSFPTVFV